MAAIPFIDVLGFWVGVFLTLCILSYLYKDNPFYKLAEHLFVGVSIGYIITQQYYNTLRPNLIEHFFEREGAWWLYFFALAMVVFLFLKAISKRFGWLGRYPVAFVVCLYAGIQINAYAQSDIVEQVKATTENVVVERTNVNRATAKQLARLPGISPPVAEIMVNERKAGRSFASLDELATLPGLTDAQAQDLAEQRGNVAGLDAQASVRSGDKYWFGILSRLFLVVGLLASLVYFYFSVAQRGVVAKVSRFGVWVLMIGFGASFGLTVQGRLALAVGRVMDVLDLNRDPRHAEQIRGPWVALVSLVIIVVGLVIWERRQSQVEPDEPRTEPNNE